MSVKLTINEILKNFSNDDIKCLLNEEYNFVISKNKFSDKLKLLYRSLNAKNDIYSHAIVIGYLKNEIIERFMGAKEDHYLLTKDDIQDIITEKTLSDKSLDKILQNY